MLDIDTLMAMKAEEKKYNEWERNKANQILRMSNPKKKQDAWREVFGKREVSNDDWMLSAKVF